VSALGAAAVGVPGPVQPGFFVERDLNRRRLTVAFRALLILPHAVVLYVLSLVGAFVSIAGWFAALVLGRLPAPIAGFLGDIVAYLARCQAYAMLITDQYPPFGFSAEGYPVGIELAPPGRLNRLAVLFRMILVIPAAILSGLITLGWTLLSFFIWLVVLVTGRTPGPVFDATAALVRYGTRYSAYFWLLTDAYPSGLFGDPDGQLALSPGAKRLMVLLIVFPAVFYLVISLVAALLAINFAGSESAMAAPGLHLT